MERFGRYTTISHHASLAGATIVTLWSSRAAIRPAQHDKSRRRPPGLASYSSMP
jgi:hypothetical protein